MNKSNQQQKVYTLTKNINQETLQKRKDNFKKRIVKKMSTDDLEIAAFAVDCYKDEIEGYCTGTLFIFNPQSLDSNSNTKELNWEMWKDSGLRGLCT